MGNNFHNFFIAKQEAFLNTACLIKREYRYSALNTLVSDGKRLFAYRDFSKEPDYYSLFTAREKNAVYVSSQVLDETLRKTTGSVTNGLLHKY